MSDPDDTESLAAEYALGTLDLEERERAEARRASDPSFDAAVAEWEARLAPLVESVPAITPPPAVFAQIEKAVAALAGAAAPVIDQLALRRALRRWRAAAVLAGAIAASLAIGLGLEIGEAQRPTYVAVLQKGAAGPGFLLGFNPTSRRLSIEPVDVRLPPDKSFELWLIAPAAKPRSLGVIDPSRRTSRRISARAPITEKATYAVTLEPKGGSPTGAPTGPILFTGKFAPLQS